MNTYEQIREIRNKHFKSKLEFGCEIYTLNDIFKLQSKGFHQNGGKGTYSYAHYYLYDEIEDEIITANEDNCKILGKPVSLQDVLRMCYGDIFSVHQNQLNELRFFEKSSRILVFTINLTKEIQDQDEEVLKQILQLIKD